MNWWQTALILLGVLWALQILGTWVQMSHYQKVMADIARAYRDGYLGTGNAKGTTGQGLIVMLVSSADGVIRKAMAMEGRTVLARFREIPELSGLTLDDLEKLDFFGPAQKARATAIGQAIAQIRKIQSESGKKAAVAGKGGVGS